MTTTFEECLGDVVSHPGHEEALAVMFDLRNAMASMVFQGIGNVDVAVVPGYAIGRGMQYKLIVRLRQGGHVHDNMMFRVFIPDEGWPCTVKDGGRCGNVEELTAMLKKMLRDDTMRTRLRGVASLARQSLTSSRAAEETVES